MKRFLITFFITLALVIGAAGAAPAAHAEDPCPVDSSGNQSILGSDGVCHFFNNETEIGTPVEPTYEEATLTDPVAEQTPVPYKGTKEDESYSWIMIKIMSLFAWLVGVAALTLDYSVYYTVVTMGDYINHLSAIGVTWRVLRDIGNILLIFGFLAVGITTILNVDWYGGGKKMLPMMLVAAVFLNFSLFISEAIIDTGNLFATQFYTQIKGGTIPSQEALSQTTIENEGISTKLMSQLGLQTIYGDARDERKEIFRGGNPWLIGFMGIILFIVTAFVMFSLSFVLIARFVALVFLLVVAPIGFAGLAIPGFAARAKDWWTQLFHQTITAPILLLMLYIALAVITDVQFLTGFGTGPAGPDWLGYVGVRNLTGFGSTILSFLVAMGLLIAVVVYAKRWSAFGGDWASRMGAKLSFGLTAAGMRSTVGLGSNLAAQAIRRSPIKATKFGRVMATTFDKGAKGSFDLRGTGVIKSMPFGSSIDAGEAQKGGYRARRDATIKAHDEYIKSVGDAIDEAGTKKDEEAKIVAAENAANNLNSSVKEANDSHKKAETAKNKAEEEVRAQKEEIERLEKIVNANRNSGKIDPAAINALNTARQAAAPGMAKLAAAETDLEVAKKKLEQAKGDYTKASTKVEEAIKESNDRISREKREAKRAYAENISGPLPVGSVPGWVAFGPGGNTAAKRIIKDARKNPTKEWQEKLRKVMEEEEKGETAPATPESPATGGASSAGPAAGAAPAGH